VSGAGELAGRGREGEGFEHGVEPAGEPLGQYPADLGRCRLTRRARRRHQPRPAAGDQAEQHGERFVVAQHERRHAVPGGEPVPAVAAAHRLDGHVEVDQVIHVPPHGAPVDAEPVGEFGHRPDAARLQELQQSQHVSSWPGHVQI